MKTIRIDIGANFSMTPGPRYRKDGSHSGQEFREDVLVPAFNDNDVVVIALDTAAGYGASFLEESFGGLVREFGLTAVRQKIRIDTTKRAFLLPFINSDMERAEIQRNKTNKQ